jgi:hypothetical protein
MKYRRKQVEVEAFRWDTGDPKSWTINAGDWLVKQDGVIRVMSNEAFEREYEEVGDGEECA